MLRHLLLLALCVFPAIAIECDKCTGRDCFEICYLRQKILTVKAKYKCADEAEADLEAETRRADEAVAALAACSASAATTTTTTTSTSTTITNEDDGRVTNEDDGRVAGVDQCFMDGGNCASCCGACVKTTDLDNSATTETCVCFEASSAPSSTFVGTEKNDCVFIAADGVQGIYVRKQCLGRRGGSARPAADRNTRDA